MKFLKATIQAKRAKAQREKWIKNGILVAQQQGERQTGFHFSLDGNEVKDLQKAGYGVFLTSKGWKITW